MRDNATVQPARDISVIGASAGGVEALREFVAELPADHAGSVFIVLHLSTGSASVLPDILARAGPLPAAPAVDGEPIEGGRIYVAPPDRHMTLEPGRVALMLGPRENGHRPAVDALFRSAARSYGERVMGVVLSGSGDDGTAGLQAITAVGGRALAQDPQQALFRMMPQSAVMHVPEAEVGSLSEIAAAIATESFNTDSEGGAPVPEDSGQRSENEYVGSTKPEETAASGLTCPDCGGALWEQENGDLLRYSCRVGHAYSVESMVVEQGSAVENVLWGALAALQAREDLLRRVSRRASRSENPITARSFDSKADDVAAQAKMLRDVLEAGVADVPAAAAEG